jgi:hypothetical protein
MNYVKFEAAYRQYYAAPIKQNVIIQQWKLLRAGVRGVDISDAGWFAWSAIGGKQ